MPGDLLRALGKVLLFSGGGMGLAIAFGGAGLAVGSVMSMVAALTAGAGCLVASSGVHRRTIEACCAEDGTSRCAGGVSIAPPMKGAEELGQDACFVEQLEAERRNSAVTRHFV